MDKILLVGGAGFLGFNFLEFVGKHWESNAPEMVVLSQETPESADQFPDVLFVQGDYADTVLLTHLFELHHFTRVFHFASSIIPALSTQNIQTDIETNLLPTIGLMEVMKAFGCQHILYLSSGGAVYGNAGEAMKHESQACEPISSYGIIKLAVEQYIRLFASLYGMHYLILRLSNPFGFHHRSSSQGVINIAIRKALRKETFVVWGDGSQAKDYVFAGDIAQAIAKLIQAGTTDQTINVGSGTSLTLNQIISIIKAKLPHFDVEFVEAMPTDVQQVCLDNRRLQSCIDWSLTPLEEAFALTFTAEQANLR